MEIKEITNKEEWENFLLPLAEKTFLQSWNWGEFSTTMSEKIWRFGAYNGDLLVAIALVLKVSAKRGTFLFIPHGPVFIEGMAPADIKEIFELILLQLSDIAKKEQASFIRVSPILAENEQNINLFLDLGFRNAPMHASAYEATWKLDISLPEDTLLKNMRKTTRYLIKKASENKDIAVELSHDPKDISIYQTLTKEVSRRQKFVPFSAESIRNEFHAFSGQGQSTLYPQVAFIFGKYNGEFAAGAMIVFWSGVAYYHQAASLGQFAKHSIPYLLQWEAIKEAKRRGCKLYDFWGFTDPEKFPRHPWAGPTLFKMGFGGYKTQYIKTQDFIISKGYWLNYIIEKIRKARRGL